jgi:glycine oxidase
VVGAGIIGCAVAYELSSRGVRVTVIDMRHPGEGATNASAGILAPYIEGHSPALLDLCTSSLWMYDEFIERLRIDAAMEVEYRRAGSLEIALNEEQLRALGDAAARYRAGGIEYRLLDRSETLGLERAVSDRVAGGLFVPAHGLVGARRLTLALISAAQARGAVVVSKRAVERVTADGSEVRVTCGDTAYSADAVVIAAGSWSGQLVIERAPRANVKPIRGQILQLSCQAPLVSRVLWGSDCYLVPWQDGTLLAGATVEDVGFDERATVAGVSNLLGAACDLLPAARAACFQAVRVGLRPATADGLPIIGPASQLPNVVYATGHHRNGVLLAPLTAVCVADFVVDRRTRPELRHTPPARFGL